MRYLEAIKLADKIEGSFIELGFGKGKNLTEFISYMNNRDTTKRNIWLYDSFEGYREPTAEDDNAFVKGGYKRPIQPAMDIIHTLKKEVKLIKGYVEDTLESSYNSEEKIAIIHTDLVSYSSTLFSLTTLNSKLNIGGVIIATGYSEYKGVKLAIDKFLKENKKEYILEHSSNIAILIKRQYLDVPTKVNKDRRQISW